MSKPPSTIEINGHRINAQTGQLLRSKKSANLKALKSTPSRSIDGLVKASSPVNRSAQVAAPRNRKPASSVHQHQQPSRTLMRKAVSKPAQHNSSSPTMDTIRVRSSRISPAKIFRAKEAAKSPKVEHFGPATVSAPRTEVSKRPSAVRPTEVLANHAASAPAASVATTRALPSVAGSLSHQQLERLLDQALLRADAHKKMLEGRYGHRNLWQRVKHAPRWLSIGLTLLIVLAAGGAYTMWQVPQVSIKVAAARAHINASVPAYTPSGYSFVGPANFEDGAITIKYASGDGSDQAFLLSQKASNWDSQSMAASVVPKEAQVQTSQIRGTTVYIYGPSNDAAWVNHGILYKLKDNANLNSEQILKIADSL